MENLAKAIIQVMKEVKGMEKNSRVGKGNNAYNGTKDQDVKEVFNDALSKNGLCILPISIDESTDINRWVDPQYGNQKQSVFTKVTSKYLLLHESGESQVIAGYGHGVDSQDKGAGKATTYALKNALLYTFLTPVGKIDDTDTTHSDDIKTPQKTKKEKLEGDKFNTALQKFNKTQLQTVLDTYDLTEIQVKAIKLTKAFTGCDATESDLY